MFVLSERKHYFWQEDCRISLIIETPAFYAEPEALMSLGAEQVTYVHEKEGAWGNGVGASWAS